MVHHDHRCWSHSGGAPVSGDELERPLVAEFYQRCFNAELPESSVNVALS